MRAALYVRVSTEDQAKEGHSLDIQRERLMKFCQDRDWSVVGVYQDDSTGTDLEREGYQRMLQETGKWDVVVAIKGDRFHRNTDNAIAFWKKMRQAGKQIWTLAEGRLDSRKNAAAWLGQMMTSALLPEFESLQISERVLPGMEKAKEKQLHVGRPYLGFAWLKKPEPRFILTKWAEKFEQDVQTFGVEGARNLNPIPSGKRAGKMLTKSGAYRLLENIRLFRAGQLIVNRKKTPSGTYSKFGMKE